MVLGSGPDWNLVPGPHLVAAGQRSIDTTSVATAQWVADNLPVGSRIAADFSNDLVLGSLGHQSPDVGTAADVDEALLFYTTRFTSADKALIQQSKIRFLLVDSRLSTGEPHLADQYFAYATSRRIQRLTSAELDKFNTASGIQRIYDDGTIRIYDLSSIIGLPPWHAKPNAADRLLYGSSTPWLIVTSVIVLAIWLRRWQISGRSVELLFCALALVPIGLMAVGIALVYAPLLTPEVGVLILATLLVIGLYPPRRRSRVRRRRTVSETNRSQQALVGFAVVMFAAVIGVGVAVGLHGWLPGPTQLAVQMAPDGRTMAQVEIRAPAGRRVVLMEVSRIDARSQPTVQWQKVIPDTPRVQLVPVPSGTTRGSLVQLVLDVAGQSPRSVGF